MPIDRRRHHAIIARIAGALFKTGREISSHGERAGAHRSPDSNSFATSDPNDRRNEGGEGKTPALAGAQIEEKTAGDSGSTYDPGGSWTGPTSLCDRSSSPGAR